MAVYNISGVEIGNKTNNNYTLDRYFSSFTNAVYTILRVYKQKVDGGMQYPFVFAPNGISAGGWSTLEMNRVYHFDIAINAGRFYTEGSNVRCPQGLLIQNGILLQQGENNWHPLTIDSNGNLGACNHDTDGQTLVNNGIVSAVNGWTPIIENYNDATVDRYSDTNDAQRQIIGQYGNGDYCILTCEGRNYDNSDGWTAEEARAICKEQGLKFAYNLDGGGSTETVIGDKQINTIYERTYGRMVPTYIIFNGTTIFPVN